MVQLEIQIANNEQVGVSWRTTTTYSPSGRLLTGTDSVCPVFDAIFPQPLRAVCTLVCAKVAVLCTQTFTFPRPFSQVDVTIRLVPDAVVTLLTESTFNVPLAKTGAAIVAANDRANMFFRYVFIAKIPFPKMGIWNPNAVGAAMNRVQSG